MIALALALLLAQAKPPPPGAALPLSASLDVVGGIYQLGPNAPPPSLSWTPPAPSVPTVGASTVALWHLDETSETYGALDATGVYDLPPIGLPQLALGVFGGARDTHSSRRFQSPTGALSTALVSTITGSFSIEFWVQRTSTGIGVPVCFDDPSHSGVTAFCIYWSAGTTRLHFYWNVGAASYYDRDTGYDLQVDGWHHIAITVSGTSNRTTTTYVDGVQVDTSTGAGAVDISASSDERLYLGGSVGGSSETVLDEVVLNSGVRTAAQILADYRLSGRWSSPPPSTLGPALALTRASTGTYEPQAGHVVTALSGETRCGYQGCLVEPSRTNVLLQSAALDSWTKFNSGASAIAVSANAVAAPDGTTTADQLTLPAVTSSQYAIIGQTGFTLGSTGATWSIYLKASSGTPSTYLYVYDTTAGAYLGSQLCSMTTNWSQCWVRVTGTAGHSINAWLGTDASPGSGMSGTGAAVVYAWGGMVETGAFPTSYIATTSTAVTRAADVLSVASSVLGAGAASLHLVLRPEWPSTVDATLLASTTPNELGLATLGGLLDFTVGGNDIATASLGWTAGTSQTLDAWYSPGGSWRVTDGTHSATGVSAATPSPGTPLYLGGSSSAGAGVVLSQVKVCKRAGVCR